MNKDQIYNPSSFLSIRGKQMVEQLESLASDPSKSQADILHDIFNTMKKFFLSIGKPTFTKRYVYDGTPPTSAVINESFLELYNDTQLIHDEQQILGESFKQSFNFSTTERTRIRNRIKEVGDKVNDYIATATNTITKCLIVQDSFADTSKVDLTTPGNPANVDTKSGIVTLKISGRINQSKSATVLAPSPEVPLEAKPPWPYTMPSNFLVAYKVNNPEDSKMGLLTKGETKAEDKWDLYYNIDRHDNANTILDGNPDTWFEYQMINVREDLKKPGANPDTKGYGWTWDSGESIYNGQKGDSLDVSLVIQLNGAQKINWIELYPYFPDKNCSLVIKDIKTSMNNASDYVSILDSSDRGRVLSSDSVPPLTVKDREKFMGKGVWTFQERECRYVKFELSVPDPYDVPIAHIYWEVEYDVKTTKRVLWSSRTSTEHRVDRVDGPKVNKDGIISQSNNATAGAALGAAAGTAILPGLGTLIGGVLGFVAGLFTNTTREIVNTKSRMGMDIYTDGKGWRWCLGIRNIDIDTNTYEVSNTFMSKVFEIPQGVSAVSLSVSEYIPEGFYSSNLPLKNSFIKYYLSHDKGTTWTPISPLERTPAYGEQDFPGKTITFTDKEPDVKEANKTFVIVNEDVKSLKLMAEISRPDNDSAKTSTPVIFDYKLRIVPKVGGDE